MSAKPVIPGLIYKVTSKDISITLTAKNGADAIAKTIDILIVMKGDIAC